MKASGFLKTAAAVSVVIFAITAFSTAAQANDDFYQVTNVQFDDSLNIRANAGAQSPVIGSIPANGRTILTTGNTQQVGNSTWMEVVWLGQIGWVNGLYLTRGAAPAVPQVQAQQRKPVETNYNYQATDTYQAPVTQAGVGHTHPANRCTRSVSHTHPNGGNTHSHRYSCQPGQQRAVQAPQRQQQNLSGQGHTHPANRCTRSVSHSHPNGVNTHQHRYACQPGQQRAVQPTQRQNDTGQGHTHPANRCTRSVSHSHPNGINTHQHRYACQPGQQAAAPVQPAPQTQQYYRPKYNPAPKYNNYQ